ncbi:lysozyme inhibitor LprI family protein [Turicibacter sanguinis]|uniref:lysozyme inhibitor LprI family protein n=1 Tax=Turicibacter sanguinis TaxID=154288 RepID=UPI00189DC2B2|nr:lysozyme inhibitor LprI family protein [Turicibacter sanguinis]
MDKVENEKIDDVYYDIFNYEEFNQKINRFFDCELEKAGNNECLFQDNNYYHPSLGTGYMLNTVTQVDRIFDNGDSSFLVEGAVYRFESSMDSNLYEQYLQPKLMWSTSMESELIGTVTTTIVYSDKLNHYVLEDYQANYYPSNEWVANESINNGLLLYSYKNEYINKLHSVEEGMSDLDYLYENGITVELIEAEETKLKRWDDMLNEIYSLLKIQLTESEMKELKSNQLSWIEYRDTTANNEASAEGGGSLSTIVYYSSLARLTKERCYELVNTYME